MKKLNRQTDNPTLNNQDIIKSNKTTKSNKANQMFIGEIIVLFLAMSLALTLIFIMLCCRPKPKQRYPIMSSSSCNCRKCRK